MKPTLHSFSSTPDRKPITSTMRRAIPMGLNDHMRQGVSKWEEEGPLGGRGCPKNVGVACQLGIRANQ